MMLLDGFHTVMSKACSEVRVFVVSGLVDILNWDHISLRSNLKKSRDLDQHLYLTMLGGLSPL